MFFTRLVGWAVLIAICGSWIFPEPPSLLLYGCLCVGLETMYQICVGWHKGWYRDN